MASKKTKKWNKEMRRQMWQRLWLGGEAEPEAGAAQQCKNPFQLPEIIENVMKHMDTHDLRAARQASRHWLSLSAPVIRTRPQTVKLNGSEEIDDYLQFLQQPESAEFRRWNLKYEITTKFTWKFEEILQKLTVILKISGPNCIEALTIFGDYFFREDRYPGLTSSFVALIDYVASGLKRLTINDNTLSNHLGHHYSFAELIRRFLQLASNLTHLIFDLSVVWTEHVEHYAYDRIISGVLLKKLKNLQHLEVLLTPTLPTIDLPKLTHFKLYLTEKLGPNDQLDLNLVLWSVPHTLKSLEIETHCQNSTDTYLPPLFVFFPNLREFCEIDKLGPCSSRGSVSRPRIGSRRPRPKMKVRKTLPRDLESIRVNIAAVIMNWKSRIYEANPRIQSLAFQLDDECTSFEPLTQAEKLNVQNILTYFVSGFKYVKKLTIDIQSVNIDPAMYIRMILCAFGHRVEVLELRNYYEDVLGLVVASEPKGSRFLTALKNIREIIVTPFEPKFMTQFKKSGMTSNPGACRLDLERILALGVMPKLEVVRPPCRFGFSWIPDSPTFIHSRDKELAKIRERYPQVEVKFL